MDQLRQPRMAQGVSSALRVLIAARDHMIAERTATVNALIPLLRVLDLGVEARRPLTRVQITTIAQWRSRSEDLGTAIARTDAIRLAKRVVELDEQIVSTSARMDELVRASQAEPVLEKTGIGTVTAAICLTTWSHHGRVRSEAAFAALAGVNPIPASSGNLIRHRLNRGGDRRLNRALHIAVLTRLTHHPETRAYVEKRQAEGRTTKEIRRCLKRYFARQIYRILNATEAPLSAA